MRSILLIPAMALCLATGSCAPTGKASPPVIHFECLWWSLAQQEHFNPNAPPTKSTLVRLTKWEYSDPVGVPHPDTVDGVIQYKTQPSQSPRAELEWHGPHPVTRAVVLLPQGSGRYVAKIDFSDPTEFSSVSLKVIDADGSVTSASLPIVAGD